MKKVLFFVVIISLATIKINAHEADNAFFIIEQKGKLIEIEAHFKWVLRDALLKFNPNIKNIEDRKELIKVLFDFVKSTISIIDTRGNQLELISVVESEERISANQNKFVLKFKGTNLASVSNKIMFNIFDEQKNYHVIINKKERKKFITSKDNPSFIVAEIIKSDNTVWWLSLIIIIPLLNHLVEKYIPKPS